MASTESGLKMTELEKLAVAQAAYKAIGAIVSTKDPDSLRGQIDAQLIEQYHALGVDRKRLTLNGVEVGKLSVAVTPPKTKVQLYLESARELTLWLIDNPSWLEQFIESKDGAKLLDFLADALVVDGEVPAGVEAQEISTPESVSTKITGCKPEDVGAALGEALPETFVGLLMEG